MTKGIANTYYRKKNEPGSKIDNDKPEILKKVIIAIIGDFKKKGYAYAKNLIDSDMIVIIVAKEGSDDWHAARKLGFTIMTTKEAVKIAKIVVVLDPSMILPKVFKNEIASHLQPGTYLGFDNGLSLYHNFLDVPAFINIFMAVPKPGLSSEFIRSEFKAGRGVPTTVAAKQDVTGRTVEFAAAYATAALGAGREGAGITLVP